MNIIITEGARSLRNGAWYIIIICCGRWVSRRHTTDANNVPGIHIEVKARLPLLFLENCRNSRALIG